MQEGKSAPVEQPQQVIDPPPQVMESPPQVVEKIVSVEPAAEGPRMRIKKPLTGAQLEALRKGREKLAEKRKAAISAEETEPFVKKDIVDMDAEEVAESDDYHSSYCSIM